MKQSQITGIDTGKFVVGQGHSGNFKTNLRISEQASIHILDLLKKDLPDNS